MERLSRPDLESLIFRLRETIYAYCDVGGFKTRLASALSSSSPSNGGDGVAPISAQTLERFGLTRREGEILRLLARGRTNKEIAADLYISPLTVRTHLEHVYEKLGVGNRTEAVARILEARAPLAGKQL